MASCSQVCSPVTAAAGQISAAPNGHAPASERGRHGAASFAQQRADNLAGFKSLYSFKGGSDGSFPLGDLLYFDGELYGTTNGYGNPGTVFKLTTSGKETVLHVFANGLDGRLPCAGLINVDGILYGTAEGGGALGQGNVFTITPSGKQTVVYSFGSLGKGRSDGFGPTGNLLSVNGTLYGTTAAGGQNDHGTVYLVDPNASTVGGAERILHDFTGGSDGTRPYTAGVIDVNGTLYGTTWYGGTYGGGTVFTISPSGVESVLYSFGSASHDGAGPLAPLVNLNGTLYGTTYGGGVNNSAGAVFSVTLSGTERVLHSFGSGSDGAVPESGLLANNGALYGTTRFGGAYGLGTVYKITPAGTESILYSFSGPDGSKPNAGLAYDRGTLYGTTETGGYTGSACGSYGCGTVFSLAL